MGNSSSGNFVASLELSPDPVHTCPEYDLFDASDGYKKLSLFVFKATASADQELISFQRWKQVRHPFILQYLDSGVHKGRKCLLTEHITPISTLLDKTGPHRIETKEELIAGFNDILEGIKFINEVCDCSHNHITLDWIMASSKSYGTWKLGGLHLISKKCEETADFARRLIAYKKANLPSSISLLSPGDSSVSSIEPLSKLPSVHMRDSYAIGKLMSKLFKKSSSVDPLANLYSGKRDNSLPKMCEILSSDLFTNSSYLKLKKCLASFATLSEDEKQKLILSLPQMIQDISEFLLSSKVIPMLLASRLIMLHPTAKQSLHAYLLVPEGKSHPTVAKSLVSCVNFEIYIIPVILKMFLVKRIGLRLILLNYLQYYGHLIPEVAIEKIVLPQVKVGMKDASDEMVVASLQAMATLVTLFGGDLIIGPKDRKKYFHYDGPRITERHEASSVSPLTSRNLHHFTNGSGKNNWLTDTCGGESMQFAHISIDDRSEPDGGEFTCSASHAISSSLLKEPWQVNQCNSCAHSSTNDEIDNSTHSQVSSSIDAQSNVDTSNAINISSDTSFSTPQNTRDIGESGSLIASASQSNSLNVAGMSNLMCASGTPRGSESLSKNGANRSKVALKTGELSKITSFDVKEIDIKLSDEIEDLFSEMEPCIDFKIAHMPSSHASSASASATSSKIASTCSFSTESSVTHERTLQVEDKRAIRSSHPHAAASSPAIVASVIPSSLFALSHESTDQHNQGDWSNDEWDDDDGDTGQLQLQQQQDNQKDEEDEDEELHDCLSSVSPRNCSVSENVTESSESVTLSVTSDHRTDIDIDKYNDPREKCLSQVDEMKDKLHRMSSSTSSSSSSLSESARDNVTL